MIKTIKHPYKPVHLKALSKEKVLKIYSWIIKTRKEKKIGQRNLAKEIKNKFGVDISESTISGWIHKNLIPYANEKTQFKPKPIPSKAILQLRENPENLKTYTNLDGRL